VGLLPEQIPMTLQAVARLGQIGKTQRDVPHLCRVSRRREIGFRGAEQRRDQALRLKTALAVGSSLRERHEVGL